MARHGRMARVFKDDQSFMSKELGYCVLVIGDIYDNHLIRFVGNLKEENKDAIIDVVATRNNQELSPRVKNAVRDIFYFVDYTNGNKYVREIKKIFGIRQTLRKLGENHHYNIVNIHFPQEEYGFSADLFKKLGDTILITPWGSDIYRCGKRGRFLLRPLFKKSDWVCGTGNRFNKDVQKFFNLPDAKFVNLDIGSESIDYISEKQKEIDAVEARAILGLKGEYFITCGYNAHKEQHHIEIIEAINSIKKELPSQSTLIFPLTYPKDTEYIDTIKKKLNECSLHAIIFDQYLKNEDLFLMRQATDMFIHVQSTDANAASVQEYLLLGKNVVNGSWLRYSELETCGIPYHLVDSLEALSLAILNAFRTGATEIPEKTKGYIASYGWKPWIKKWNEFFISTLK